KESYQSYDLYCNTSIIITDTIDVFGYVDWDGDYDLVPETVTLKLYAQSDAIQSKTGESSLLLDTATVSTDSASRTTSSYVTLNKDEWNWALGAYTSGTSVPARYYNRYGYEANYCNWLSLPKYDSDGNEITYQVVQEISDEEDWEQVSVSKSLCWLETGWDFTATNMYTGTTEYAEGITIVWQKLVETDQALSTFKPDSLTLELYGASGEWIGEVEITGDKEAGTWYSGELPEGVTSAVITEESLYSTARIYGDGTEFSVTTESAEDGKLVLSVGLVAYDEVSETDTYTYELCFNTRYLSPYVTLPSQRSVTVSLYADGELVGSSTSPSGTGSWYYGNYSVGGTRWTYRWTDQPVYDEDGDLIEYTVKVSGLSYALADMQTLIPSYISAATSSAASMSSTAFVRSSSTTTGVSIQLNWKNICTITGTNCTPYNETVSIPISIYQDGELYAIVSGITTPQSSYKSGYCALTYADGTIDKSGGTYYSDGSGTSAYVSLSLDGFPVQDSDGNHEYTVVVGEFEGKSLTTVTTNDSDETAYSSIYGGTIVVLNHTENYTYSDQVIQAEIDAAETIYLAITKIWLLDSATDRPDSVTYQIYGNVNGEDISQYTYDLKAGGGISDNVWANAVELPKYDSAGNLISYRVEEAAVDGYLCRDVTEELTAADAAENGYYSYSSKSRLLTKDETCLINLYLGYNSADTAVRYDLADNDFVICLYGNGELLYTMSENDTSNGNNTGVSLLSHTGYGISNNYNSYYDQWIFKAPVYDGSGNLIEYTIEYTPPTGYGYNGESYTQSSSTYYSTYDGESYLTYYTTLSYYSVLTATNTNVALQKVWTDNENVEEVRPDWIQMNLYANGVLIDSAYAPTSTKVSQLAYRTLYSANNDHAYTSYTGTGVTVNLKNFEELTITRVVCLNGCGWVGLPRYDYRGNEIIYTVEEGDVGEYTLASVNSGYSTNSSSGTFNGSSYTIYNRLVTMTNQYVPTTSVTVSKKWDDLDNTQNTRPASIEVLLYAGDNEVGSVTLNEQNQWTYTWEGLAKYLTGSKIKIEYTVKEADVPDGYEAAYSDPVTLEDSGGTELVITNTLMKVSASVEKVWDDYGDAEGIRPSGIWVQLYADDEEIGSIKRLRESNSWSYTWKDLERFDADGKEIVYTVEELYVPDGYKVSYTAKTGANGEYATVITNSLVKTDISVVKTWADDNDSAQKRPTYVRVQLYANGEKTGAVIWLHQDNGWTYTWKDLERYDKDGKEISYTVDELSVPDGYRKTTEVSADGRSYQITNTLTPTETTPETDPETPTGTTPETNPETESETTPETDPETDPETTPETDPETTPETDPETTPETDPETESETTSETDPETTPETIPETTPETTPETDSEVETETETVSETETETETTPETGTETETTTETGTETETTTETGTESESEMETSVQTGDDTPLTFWMAMMALAAAVLLLMAGENRKRRQEK
ncbi:MAG: Cna B-type domain-containing protein, partial [Lachnospiraceae bacterium]|nr:Cna B-type domain-containing protein [Lachnospiraceae bacterium]